jgi:hypothetical protein
LRIILSGFATIKNEHQGSTSDSGAVPCAARLAGPNSSWFSREPFQKMREKRGFEAKIRGFNPNFSLVSRFVSVAWSRNSKDPSPLYTVSLCGGD